jgi:YidC/Oxa1 family membrane protein insertase
MKKFLDIFIFSLLIVLTINLFFGDNQKTEKVLSGEVIIETTDKSYTIPPAVGLKITNNSTWALVFNACKDIALNFSGKNVELSHSDCSYISIASGTDHTVNFTDDYETFTQAGQYNLQYTESDNRHITSFDVEHRWSISKLFSALFYAPIFNIFVFLITTFWNVLGWAILAITVLIRIVLLWPQHKMMISQKKLQAIQPKIKKIQEENKGNQQAIGQKLMELYKTEKVNPMGSCGFLIIQMPILLVIYNIILSIKDPSNFFHIYDFQSNFDLSAINFDFFGIDLLASGWITGVILAITVALIQFTQVKLSLSGKKTDSKDVVLEKKKGDTGYNQMMPDPEMMNKFMLYGMPAMVAVFTYTLIAWVGIYWGTSTLFMVFQQLVVNKVLKK